MKKVFKWIGIVLLSPILLFIILTALLYVPPIQNWVVQKVASYASEQTGMQISVEHVDLSFPLDLSIDGVRIVKGSDTIIDIRNAVADVQLWPLLDSRIVLNQLELNEARLNTIDFIDDLRLHGKMGHLSFTSPGIDLERMEMALKEPLLRDADLTVYMSDTAAIDTSTVGWHILMDRFQMERTAIRIVMDSTALFQEPQTDLRAYMGQAQLNDADLHLGLGRFRFGTIDWEDGQLSMGDDLRISNLSLGLDSLYSHAGNLRVGLRHGALKEEVTGLELTSLEGLVAMDGEGVRMNHLKATTPYSSLTAEADINFAALDSLSRGQMSLQLDATVGKEDLKRFAEPSTLHQLPDHALTVHAQMSGNMQQARIEKLSIMLPSAFKIDASGTVRNLNEPDRLLSQLDLKMETFNTDFLNQMAGLTPDFTIPRGMKLAGRVNTSGPRYTADLTMQQASGSARLKGTFNQQLMSYDAEVHVQNLNLRNFMPRDTLGLLSADMKLSGQGTDPFSANSRLNADIQLHHLQMGSRSIDSVDVQATLTEGRALATLTSSNPLVNGTVHVDAQLTAEPMQAAVNADLLRVDLMALGVTDEPTVIGLCGDVQMNTDTKLTHYVQGRFTDIYISDSVQTHYPEKIGLLVKTAPDTTVLRLQSGDLIVKLDAADNYEQLFSQLGNLADSVNAQLKSRTINQPKLKQMLPTMKLYVSSEKKNPMAEILRTQAGIDYRQMLADLSTSPLTGVNGQARIYSLNADSTRLDTLRLTLVDKAERGLTFNGQVTNNRRNPQRVFNALFDGLLQEHGASIGLRYYDERGQLGLRIGAQAEMVADGLRFHLIPARPTLGYKEFALNDDNFLLLRNDLKLQAKVDLIADDGTGVKVYSEDQDSTLLQDLTISLHQFDLGTLTSALPYMPSISGQLNGDYHLMMDARKQMSVASDMEIRQLAYEGNPMGNIGMEFVYLQRKDESHALDAVLKSNDEDIGTLKGSFHSNGKIDAALELAHMPLTLMNGFISDQLFGFEGFAEGTVSLQGTLSRPQANGELYLSEASLVSQPYGMRLRFDDDPVRIIDSKLLLENFTMYAHNNNPLNIMGNIDFHDTSHMTMDLRMRTTDFQLINSKQTKESIAYGKMFINLFARMNGPMERLSMRGRLDILGTTDLNYILLDSPLSTDNQLDELVKFTDFSDTTQTVVQRPEPQGLDMDMTISIDQGAHVRCDLNAEQTNYVDLFGGGELRMRYTNEGLTLNGRYTVASGQMKYSLPIIPLKTFTIQEGSYVEFTGDPGNPTLNLTATERTRAAVGQEDGQSRSVLFDCGVVITKTLADMGLAFTINAPEDMTVANELASMTVEQRGKLAVTMLTTGMYLSDGNTSGFSMNSALSSFLQSEINNLTAGALKTLDLELGLDNTTDASGQMHTDYSFKFAKRFWNNRLKVQIGGKVSTGAEVQGQNKSFFDNVTMEYRLSPTSNQYVKLFYSQNVYDWLEGYTGEYGGGFIWKRKLDSLGDIFRKSGSGFNRGTPGLMNNERRTMNSERDDRQPADSTQTTTSKP